ncbi:class I SAM-dependent methyltransferase [Roseibium salinum]|uniref:Class I SAM-dependent methyltransferase n=1 Tax=Roseibium salinum TaxID=1604349 RepID=A0ABT3R3R8_9HYPH|nr:class I SAM-dependent methyltransferase [Roseibium sp. DSM 29163]MCX2723740.1 class I SAM-dependent methyltransferase [Roseibium sp. DSM 29163]
MSEAVETARLMDAVYRHQRHVYDLTRKYYLLGRDHLIEQLAPPAGGTVLELGCGTGRNLIAAAKRYPQARFYGLDISRHMLDTAAGNIAKAGLGNRIDLIEGDAADPAAIDALGVQAFDRVFYSYTLSMIPIWRGALSAGAARLGEGGRIHVVDFGQQERLPAWFKKLLLAWLKSFHVTPRADLEQELRGLAGRLGADLRFRPLYRGYAAYAELQNAVLREEASLSGEGLQGEFRENRLD